MSTMATTKAELLAALSRPRRNVLALLTGVGPLLVAHLLVPHWSTKYGSYLVAFSVWMIWFVLVVADLLGEPLDAEGTSSE